MTTQIVASKLNGELALAQVETVMLAAARPAGSARPCGGRGPCGRRWAPACAASRRPAGGSRARSPAAPPACSAGCSPSSCCCRTPCSLLVSLVPAFTWTAEAFPPVLNLGNWTALFTEPEHLRPVVNSLWMAVAATVARPGARVRRGAAGVRPPRPAGRGARGADRPPLGGAGHRLRHRPRHHLQRPPALARPLRADRHPVDPAARLPGARPAADRPRRRSPGCASSTPRSKRRRPRSAPGAGAGSPG